MLQLVPLLHPFPPALPFFYFSQILCLISYFLHRGGVLEYWHAVVPEEVGGILNHPAVILLTVFCGESKFGVFIEIILLDGYKEPICSILWPLCHN